MKAVTSRPKKLGVMTPTSASNGPLLTVSSLNGFVPSRRTGQAATAYKCCCSLSCLMLACALTAGCAGIGYPRAGPECSDFSAQALPEAAPRLDFADFSVLPPQGPHWCVANLDQRRGSAFAKNWFGGRVLQAAPSLGEIRNTMIAEVAFQTSPGRVESHQDLERIAQGWFADYQSSVPLARFITKTLEPDNGQDGGLCARTNYRIEGPISQQWTNEIFTLQGQGVLCKHPSRPVIVLILWTERFLRDSPPSQSLMQRYRNEVEPFLHGLQFKR